jgi:scyllo-inosose 3-dehydrogenase
MNSILLNAEWCPKADYSETKTEEESRLANMASQVWRNPTFSFQQTSVPSIASDEVLIKVGACGVCGSDTHCYETDDEGYVIFSGPAQFPVIPGHEFSGEIVEVGSGVNEFHPGQLVVAEGMVYCGMCRACRIGQPNQCPNLRMLGFSIDGAYAEYVAIKAKLCWSIDGLAEVYGDRQRALEVGALVEPIACSYNGIFVASSGMRPGDFVVVFGAGPIGLGAIALARASGAAKVIAFDVSDARCELALECGATEVWNPLKLASMGTQPSEAVLSATQGWGADVIVEAAGAALKTMPEIERMLAPAATMVYLGRTGERAPVMLDTLVSGASSIVGSRGHAGGGCFSQVIRLLESQQIHAEPMITSRLPFNSFMDAIEQSCLRTDGKIILTY